MAAMRRPGTAVALAALAAPLAAVSVEGFFWSSTPSSADDHSSNDAGGLLESIFYDYDYDYGFLSDSLLGELFAEFNATMAELSSELYSLSGVAWDGADEHHDSVIWDLEARLAAAEERIAELEREGAENLWWKEWLEQDATAIHAAAVEEGAVTHTMGTEYPFGVMGAGIPWVGVVADDPAADSAMPPMLSVDLASAMGIAQSYLNGAFSSCVQRGADGSVAGLFTTAIGAVANATGDGSFNLTGSRIANALGTIDIECTLFGLVGSSGDASHDVQAALDSMRAMTSSLPASHVPHPCKRPHGEAEEDDHLHPRGGEHDHMACLEEGEHVEALGGFGVHVGDGAIAAGSTVEVPTVLTHPTTGETFTIYVSVSAHDAADIHVGKPRGKPADRFPNDEGEPESVLREGETDRWNFAFIGMCLGGAALLVSLLVAAAMLSRKRMVVRPAPAHVGMNARPRASGSSTTKARLPDSAVIVAMPGDLAAVDAAVVAEVVDMPPTSRA